MTEAYTSKDLAPKISNADTEVTSTGIRAARVSRYASKYRDKAKELFGILMGLVVWVYLEHP